MMAVYCKLRFPLALRWMVGGNYCMTKVCHSCLKEGRQALHSWLHSGKLTLAWIPEGAELAMTEQLPRRLA
jgi:hypothetical protein